jgi:GT2 family glycosyltransferase
VEANFFRERIDRLQVDDFVIFAYGSGSNLDLSCKHFANLTELMKALELEQSPNVLVLSAGVIDAINFKFLSTIDEPFDLIHCGLQTGMASTFEILPVTSFSWFFLNSTAQKQSVSWKANPECFVINTNVYRSVGGVDLQYESWEARIADLAYRILRSGGKVFNQPNLLLQQRKWADKTVPLRDYLRFVNLNVNPAARVLYILYLILNRGKLIESVRAFESPKKKSGQAKRNIIPLIDNNHYKSIEKYSAIIPTIDRYEYLPAAVDSLLEQEIPPDDIIVYDQTPRERRDHNWFLKYPADRVKVIFSDFPGQSTARNEAIKNTRHEWCLMFDDDSIAFKDMSRKHIELIERSNFYVSTGASLSPGQELQDLPYNVDYLHLADVLDTGNCFIHKSIWEKVGGFDKAFNRGPGADNDFGTRIYLEGIPVVFNNLAKRIHFKASKGGLRSFGVWWRFKTSFQDPYPPPSQTYTIMKFYSKSLWSFMFLRFFIKASYRQNIGRVALLWLLYPLKLRASKKRAIELKKANEHPSSN